MRIPKNIPIFGKDHELIIAADEGDEEAGGLLKGTITMVNPESETEHDTLHTVLHEMGHAMSRRCGFFQGLDEQLEEAWVDAYATMIMETFDIKFKKELLKEYHSIRSLKTSANPQVIPGSTQGVTPLK